MCRIGWLFFLYYKLPSSWFRSGFAAVSRNLKNLLFSVTLQVSPFKKNCDVKEVGLVKLQSRVQQVEISWNFNETLRDTMTMMMFGSPYEDDTACFAPTQVMINNMVSMKIDLSQKYRSHHITYIFLEPPENVTFGQWDAWFIDHIWAAWQRKLDPCIDELASMFFELMVCGWQVSAYRILSKLAVQDVHVAHENGKST